MASTRDPAVERRVRAAGIAALLGAVLGPAVVGGVAGAATPPVACSGVPATDGAALVEAVAAAVAGPQPATVTLTAGCTYSIGASSVTDAQGSDAFAVVGSGVDLTLAGSGATVTATGAFRFFEVASGGTLALQDVALTGGADTSGQGGGAVLNDGTLTADTVAFAGDTTTANGGAIDSGDAAKGAPTVQLTNSTFIDDSATGTDNALAWTNGVGDGGAVDVADDGGTGSLTVTGGTFTDDSVGSAGEEHYGDGGAIAVADNGGAGSLSVSGSTFTGDQTGVGSSQGNGGAIAAGESGGTIDGAGIVTIDTSTFSTDTADGAGGAVDVGGNGGGAYGNLEVTDSTFTQDATVSPFGEGPAPGGAISVGDGGSGFLAVSGSTFSQNVAARGGGNGDGGALAVADDDSDGGALEVSDSTFSQDLAASDGGAIFVGELGSATPAVRVRPGGPNAASVEHLPHAGVASVVASTFDGSAAGGNGGTFAAVGGSTTFAADLLASPAHQQVCASPAGGYLLPTDGGDTLATDGSCGPTDPSSHVVAGLAADIEPLANNGGATETMALAPLPDPAVGAIPNGTADPAGVTVPTPYPDLCPRTDQTGFASPAGAPCAIGAYEPRTAGGPPSITALPPATVDVTLTVDPSTVTDGTEGAAVFTASATGSEGAPTGTVSLSTSTGGSGGTTGTTGGSGGTTGGATGAARRAAGSTPLCTVTLVAAPGSSTTSSGTCSPSAGSLAPGTYAVTGAYSGNGTYPTATTNTVTFVVTAPPTAPAGSSACSLQGYRLAGTLGQVYAYGPARFGGALPSGPGGLGIDPNGHVVGIAATPDCLGYWLAGSDGGVFTFGDANFDASLPKGPGGLGIVPAAPIVGIVATGDGLGYWLVGSDGGVFAFGDAPFDTSLPPGPGGLGVTPSAPIAGIAGTPDRRGYWLVGRDGAVYALGDARFLGGANTLNHDAGPGQPIVGIAATPDGGGYWLVGRDGAVYAYGDAAYLGGASTAASPVVGILATPDGGGYWLAEQDGTVVPVGDAQDLGDLSGGAAAGTTIVGIGH